MKSSLPKFISFIETPSPESGDQKPDGEDAPEATPEGEDTDEDPGDEEDEEESGWDHARALAKIRKANAEAKSQRDRALAAEQKAASAKDAEDRAAKAEAHAMRLEVGYELGLPPKLAARLKGDTPEELQADAEELLALFEAKKPVVPSNQPKPRLRGGATPDEEVESDAKSIVAEALSA